MKRAATALLLALATLVPVLPAGGTPAPGIVPSRCERTDGGYRCLVGPFDIEQGETIEIFTGVAAPSEAGFFTWGKANVVDGSGDNVPHHLVHLHHALWLNPYEDDMTCDSYDGGRFPDYERFFATGKERTKVELPKGYGYLWDPKVSQPHTQSAPWWGLVVHLDGVHGASDAYLELNMGFVPKADAPDTIAVKPVWLDVRNCSSSPVYTVKKGSGRNDVHKERWSFEMPVGGRFVFIGGHLHDGGLRVTLDNLTTDDRLYTSRARYGPADDPWFLTKMTTWSGNPGMQVSKDDELRITSVYDSSRTWRGVMGIMVGVLAPAP